MAHWHTLFELLAYFIGFRWFLFEKNRLSSHPLQSTDNLISVFIGVLFGALIGAKLLNWAQDPGLAFSDFPRSAFGSGKTIVGALLGGWLGVELAKKLTGITTSTGDAMAVPILMGIAIGRIGCFLAGLSDATYGVATTLPWGWDYGDGVVRHPTQIYEILFLITWAVFLSRRRGALLQNGDLFKLALGGYLLCRLLVDAIKPMPVDYVLGLSAIQLACIAGLIALAPHASRLMRGLAGRQLEEAT